MEPMDFDSDEDLSFGPGHRASTSKHEPSIGHGSHRLDFSDMDIDLGSPIKDLATAESSESFDHISSTLGSVLSLKNAADFSDDETLQSKGESDFLYMSKLGRKPQKQGSLDHNFSKTWEPAATAILGALAFKKVKTSPEGETEIAHFPNVLKKRVHPRKSASDPKIKSTSSLSSNSNSKHSESEQDLRLKSSWSPVNDVKEKPKQSRVLFILIVLLVPAVSVFYFWHVISERQRCGFSRDFNKRVLEMELDSNVFGQHLAARIIPDKIEEYFSKFRVNDLGHEAVVSEPEKDPILCKPLVLSFDGWTGVGKNYVSKFIVEAFKNSRVMHFIMPLHFPHKAFDDVYHLQIQEWILGNFSQCMVNLIVIDEMDKAFPGVTQGLSEAISALTKPCSTAGPVIFLLLSNTNANDINRAFLKYFLESPTSKREQLSQNHFSSIFFSDKGSWSSLLVKKHLIDAFIPFLPLEKEHVIQCIKRDLISKRFSTDAGTVNKVLQELSFSSFGDIYLSHTGCKRVADKVDLVMFEKH